MSIQTYYEPFVGGGNVIGNLVMDANRKVAGDIIRPLIDFYEELKTSPVKLFHHYMDNWQLLQKDRNHFYTVRTRFNDNKKPYDFFFLCRTSHNGLIRFNNKGNFNAPVSHNPDGRSRGMSPKQMFDIISEWRERLLHVNFFCSPFQELLADASPGDFVYCDPPYDGLSKVYGKRFEVTDLFATLEELNRKGVRWMCSYSHPGKYEFKELSKDQIVIVSGPSSFRKLNGDGPSEVKEMLYRNYV